jgi:hypothetical protein
MIKVCSTGHALWVSVGDLLGQPVLVEDDHRRTMMCCRA